MTQILWIVPEALCVQVHVVEGLDTVATNNYCCFAREYLPFIRLRRLTNKITKEGVCVRECGAEGEQQGSKTNLLEKHNDCPVQKNAPEQQSITRPRKRILHHQLSVLLMRHGRSGTSLCFWNTSRTSIKQIAKLWGCVFVCSLTACSYLRPADVTLSIW